MDFLIPDGEKESRVAGYRQVSSFLVIWLRHNNNVCAALTMYTDCSATSLPL